MADLSSVTSGAAAPDFAKARHAVAVAHARLSEELLDDALATFRTTLDAAESLLREQQQEIARLKGAIRWALGEDGDFPRASGKPPFYYWRTELRKRAGFGPPPPSGLVHSEASDD